MKFTLFRTFKSIGIYVSNKLMICGSAKNKGRIPPINGKRPCLKYNFEMCVNWTGKKTIALYCHRITIARINSFQNQGNY